jgi:hypothetical protein
MRSFGNLRLLVHFADERPHARIGELADAVAENPLVFGEQVRGLGEFGGVLGHGGSPATVTGPGTNWGSGPKI